MKELRKDEKGFSVLAVALILVLLLAVGGGVWYYGMRDDGSESARTGSGETSSETAASDMRFAGSYFDAIGRGQPLECDWRVPEDSLGPNQAGEGKLYTDGSNRGRSEAAFIVSDRPTNTYAIIIDDNIYQWTDIGGQSVGIIISKAAAEASAGSLSEEDRQQGTAYAVKYSFDCQPWTVDESKFVLPEGVEFSEAPITPSSNTIVWRAWQYVGQICW
jgi:hypothetical protein